MNSHEFKLIFMKSFWKWYLFNQINDIYLIKFEMTFRNNIMIIIIVWFALHVNLLVIWFLKEKTNNFFWIIEIYCRAVHQLNSFPLMSCTNVNCNCTTRNLLILAMIDKFCNFRILFEEICHFNNPRRWKRKVGRVHVIMMW